MSSAPLQGHLGYRPGLDGIRGIAILLVILVHDGIIRDGFAFIGINTFFVLSGFLITTLLVGEWDQTGDISFASFYMRRVLRLLPALVAMLVVFLIYVVIFDPRTKAHREFYEALRALFYFTNWARIYRIGESVMLVHTWSLSVEEQFYLVWPPLLWWLLRKTNRGSLLCWIFLGAFLSLLTRIGLLFCGTDHFAGNVYPVNPDRLVIGLHTRADSLLLGCFTGVLLSSKKFVAGNWSRAFTGLAFACVAGLFLLGTQPFLTVQMVCVGWFLASIFAVLLIAQQILFSGTVVHWILENPVLVYLGKISYGLYLWNYPILLIHFRRDGSAGYPWLNLAYLVPVFAAVLASYYFIERPCLRLKRRFQKVT